MVMAIAVLQSMNEEILAMVTRSCIFVENI